MSNSILYQLAARAQKATFIEAKFAPNGSSALVQSAVIADGVTITRTGVGLFKFLFTDRWPRLLAFGAEVKLATPVMNGHAFGPIDPANAVTASRFGTWQYFNAAGTAADIAAAADNEVSLWFILQNQMKRPS